jgi:O-antigen ligase
LAVLFIAGFAQLPKRIVLPIVTVVAMLVVSIHVSGETTEIMRLVSRDGSAQEAETMSGRLDLWEFTERMIADLPLLGYGLGSFETYAQIAWTGETRNDLVQPHNNYLALFYNSGILGSIPWIAAFILLLRRWFTTPFLPRDIFVVAILVTGYSEADLPSNSIMATFTFFIVIALDARRRQGLERRATIALAEVPQYS